MGREIPRDGNLAQELIDAQHKCPIISHRLLTSSGLPCARDQLRHLLVDGSQRNQGGHEEVP